MHQFVTLTRGGEQVKQSTRRATYVTVDELLEEVGARRVPLLHGPAARREPPRLRPRSRQGHRLEEEPGLLRAVRARAQHAIERKARERGVALPDAASVDADPLVLPEEIEILKKLAEFPEVVQRAAETREPHHVCYYVRELAGLWNPYLQDGVRHRVLSDDAALTSARLGPRARGADRARERAAAARHLRPGAHVMNERSGERRGLGRDARGARRARGRRLPVRRARGLPLGGAGPRARLSRGRRPRRWTGASRAPAASRPSRRAAGERGARGGPGAEARAADLRAASRTPRAGARGGAGRAAGARAGAGEAGREEAGCARAPGGEARAAPKPRPRSRRRAGRRFAVQVGAFGDSASAEELVARLRGAASTAT